MSAVAAHQDFLLDNITNTLDVAAADAEVAKRLFVFLGVPGGMLAAMLAAYAGSVLADAQRREQATLRIRGASRRHLLRMLALAYRPADRGSGAVVGLAIGYGAASVSRSGLAEPGRHVQPGHLGGPRHRRRVRRHRRGPVLTGRRSIDREINEDRARMAAWPPVWRRAGLDVIGVAVVAIGTVVAIRTHAFDGAPGSVYFGRSVELNLALLVLPVAVLDHRQPARRPGLRLGPGAEPTTVDELARPRPGPACTDSASAGGHGRSPTAR